MHAVWELFCSVLTGARREAIPQERDDLGRLGSERKIDWECGCVALSSVRRLQQLLSEGC